MSGEYENLRLENALVRSLMKNSWGELGGERNA